MCLLRSTLRSDAFYASGLADTRSGGVRGSEGPSRASEGHSGADA